MRDIDRASGSDAQTAKSVRRRVRKRECRAGAGNAYRTTVKATADHGQLKGDTVHGTYDEARTLFADLEKLGVSYDDVVKVLEDEGVSKFEVSWNELLDTIRAELNR